MAFHDIWFREKRRFNATLIFFLNFRSSSYEEFKMSLYLIFIQQKIAFSFMQLRKQHVIF